MVEVINRIPKTDFLTRSATEVKETSPEIRSAHTRPCYEVNEAKNCKITVEKEVPKSQAEFYEQVLAEQREKEEKGAKRRKRERENFRNRRIVQEKYRR